MGKGKGKIRLFALIVLLPILFLAAFSLFSDPTPGPPTGTAGKRVLVLYDMDVPYCNQAWINFGTGMQATLNGFGFNS